MTKNLKKDEKHDVFNSFWVKNARYDGEEEIPRITTSNLIPQALVPFTKMRQGNTVNSWVHFYEHDYKIECFWRNPRRYLAALKQHPGVISPDYSLYYDMPLNMQKNNIYRGKALAHWLQENGLEIIPNVRWGDERTFETACLGVEHGKTIAIGTHGCIRSAEEKQQFNSGLDYVINRLEPTTIIVYGRTPDKIFNLIKFYDITIIPFESEFSISHQKEQM